MNPCVDAQTHASKRRAATSYPIAHCFLEIDVCKRLLCMRQQDKPIHLATLSMQVAAGVEAWPHNSRLAGGGLNAKSLVPHHLKAVKVSSEHPDPRDAANASDKQCWRPLWLLVAAAAPAVAPALLSLSFRARPATCARTARDCSLRVFYSRRFAQREFAPT